jgi:putative copper export protein
MNDPVGRQFLPRFSPIAVSGMAMLVVAGSVTAYLYVGSLSNLRDTLYGRVLGAKILLFAGVALCGWFNWRRFSHDTGRDLREGDSARTVHRRRVLPFIEVYLTVAVVILTGVLSHLAHP